MRTAKLGNFEGCNYDVCTSNTILFAEEVAVRALPSADVMNASHLNTQLVSESFKLLVLNFL